MPRLINIEDELLLKTVSVGGLSAKALWRLIKSQRTIKAIPIEWLKKWEGYEQGMAIVNLKDIVKYWEKENETRNSN